MGGVAAIVVDPVEKLNASPEVARRAVEPCR
jgi:hypothetical protein